MARVCPWWLGFFLINPLRRLMQNPVTILEPHVKTGMTALDVGSGMGYFSIPMAKLVGPKGRVVCLDVQEKMLSRLNKRAELAGMASIIESRLSSNDTLHIEDLRGKADFALIFAVAHEAPDVNSLFREISGSMKRGGRILFAEPRGHVDLEDFEDSIKIAGSHGLTVEIGPAIWGSHSALLVKR